MIDLLGMQRAVWRSARTTTEKIVLLAIADFYSDRSPEPWPSVPTLAERCSLGRTAVLEAIATLERDGVLVVRPRAGPSKSLRPFARNPAARPNGHAKGCDLARPHARARRCPPGHGDLAMGRRRQPVRDATRSAWRTGPVAPANGTGPPSKRATSPHQSTWRTGPVRLANGTSSPGGPEGSEEGSKEGSHRCASQTRPTHLARNANCRTRQARARGAAGSPTTAAAALARNTKNRRRVWHGRWLRPPIVRNCARFGPARNRRTACSRILSGRPRVDRRERAKTSLVAPRRPGAWPW